jgi:hypothetical protein
VQPGENSYACELSTIDELGFGDGNARAAGGHGTGGDNVVCLGWDGGVDIWRIGRNTVEQIGKLEGLRGSVKGAKVRRDIDRAGPGLHVLGARLLRGFADPSKPSAQRPVGSPSAFNLLDCAFADLSRTRKRCRS